MSIPRQVKDFVGATSGSFFSDSLGNGWSLNISSVSAYGEIEVYYTPDGSGGATIGGVLTYRGITLDAPVLTGALVVAICYFRKPGGIKTMTRQTLIEFGISATNNPADSDDYDIYSDTAQTAHKHGIGPSPSSSTNPQVWLAAHITNAASAIGTPPSEFSPFGFNTTLERAYYRIGSVPLTDHTAAFTTVAAADVIAIITHFDDVAPSEPIVGSAVFGVTTTVKATRAIAFGLNGATNVHDEAGKFKVFGDFEVTGTSTFGSIGSGSVALDDLSDVTITSPATFQVLAYSGSQWVNTNAVGQILTVSVTLTNAQIKALPTTEINLLSALGATIRAKFIGATLRINSSAGAYTNISAGAYLVVATPGEAVTLSGYIGDNASPALTHFSDVFAAADDIVVDLIPYARDTATGFGVSPQTTTPVSGVVNTAVHLVMSNSGGDLTGGHASNSGAVTLYYTPETLA